jgi:hypothetical protein
MFIFFKQGSFFDKDQARIYVSTIFALGEANLTAHEAGIRSAQACAANFVDTI